MRLVEARQVMNQQLDFLDVRRSQLQKQLKEAENNGNFDRVELSKELEALDKTYEETFQERERLNTLSTAIQNAEISKQQAEAQAEATKELLKCLQIFKRIANGDKVPTQDERKLMEYDSKMYMMAKSMSILHMNDDHKEHDSLWGEEESKGEAIDPAELANNTEVALSVPEIPQQSGTETID